MFSKKFNPWMSCLTILLLLNLTQTFAADGQSTPRVVVSIKPLHSIVAGVMQGIATPELIVDGSASPHTYRLKPSAARALQEADAIFWAGDNVETFLIKPLTSLPRQAKVIALSEIPGIQLLPARGGKRWKSDHDHADKLKDSEGHKDHTDTEGALHDADPHVWLDPLNTIVMVKAIVHTLSEVDPQHASQYQHNGQQIEARLNQLNQTLKSELEPVSGLPFMVFHDGYQYLEKRYHLTAVGSVVFQMDQATSARRLRRLHKLIEVNGVNCVFSEPEFSSKKVHALIRGTRIKTEVLDPLGSDLPPGSELYFTMMTNLGKSIEACLGG
jgi:zinc transport system substrate-binding protein